MIVHQREHRRLNKCPTDQWERTMWCQSFFLKKKRRKGRIKNSFIFFWKRRTSSTNNGRMTWMKLSPVLALDSTVLNNRNQSIIITNRGIDLIRDEKKKDKRVLFNRCDDCCGFDGYGNHSSRCGWIRIGGLIGRR